MDLCSIDFLATELQAARMVALQEESENKMEVDEEVRNTVEVSSGFKVIWCKESSNNVSIL